MSGRLTRGVLHLLTLAACAAVGAAGYAWLVGDGPKLWGDATLGPGAVLLSVSPRAERPDTLAALLPDDAAPLTPESQAAALRLTRRRRALAIVMDPGSATRSTAWYKQFHNDDEAAADAFAEATKIRAVPGTSLITVDVRGPTPGDAATMASEFCEKYVQSLQATTGRRAAHRIELLKTEQRLVEIDLQDDVRRQLAQREQALASTGVTPDGSVNILNAQLLDLQKARLAAEAEVRSARRAVAGAKDNAAEMPKANARVDAAVSESQAVNELFLKTTDELAKATAALGEVRALRTREVSLTRRSDELNTQLSKLAGLATDPQLSNVEILSRAATPLIPPLPSATLRWAAAAVGFPAALWLAYVARRAVLRPLRRRQGRCVRCGYDLRGGAGVCPECGTTSPDAKRNGVSRHLAADASAG